MEFVNSLISLLVSANEKFSQATYVYNLNISYSLIFG